MLRLALATLHLLALGIGMGAVWVRARSLAARPLDVASARRAFVADSWWGVAALVWISTGFWRLIAGTEKATTYYLHDPLFLAKMALLGLVLLLEIWPATTLVRWRLAAGREGSGWRPDAQVAGRLSGVSYVQVAAVVAMVVAAVAMARGYGSRVTG